MTCVDAFGGDSGGFMQDANFKRSVKRALAFGVLLSLPPVLVAEEAVEQGVVEEIQAKATSANEKADGNRGRIQALEAEDQLIHQRIDDIEQRLAGKSCPTGLAVVGFDAEGDLVCAAPWNVPTGGGPPSGITFTCTINYDQQSADQQIVGRVSAVQTEIATNGIQPLQYDTALLELTAEFVSITFAGDQAATATLVELTEEQPCQDAIAVSATVSTATIEGQWEATVFGLSTSGTFEADVDNIVVSLLLRLSSLDLASISVGSFDRELVEAVLVAVDGGAVAISFSDGLGGLVDTVANLIESSIAAALAGSVGGSITQAIGDGSVSIGAPVTVEVTGVP